MGAETNRGPDINKLKWYVEIFSKEIDKGNKNVWLKYERDRIQKIIENLEENH